MLTQNFSLDVITLQLIVWHNLLNGIKTTQQLYWKLISGHIMFVYFVDAEILYRTDIQSLI